MMMMNLKLPKFGQNVRQPDRLCLLMEKNRKTRAAGDESTSGCSPGNSLVTGWLRPVDHQVPTGLNGTPGAAASSFGLLLLVGGSSFRARFQQHIRATLIPLFST